MRENANLDDYFFVLFTQSRTKCVGTLIAFFYFKIRYFAKCEHYEIIMICLKKLETFLSQAHLPFPHQSMLDTSQTARTNFQESTLIRGERGEF
jgi:hypothetical protein